ncbi:flagellar hook-length control protein FliK [Salinarimonas ramus]|uniref:Flagellar hook-length control protein-like C-terminal domain-containing protein n=1 Tax=Salinarimonas ramus TaxID=690164 RepID=A0A917Q682_9HYPH|nr:flagellar hook-length control protein FliK [Salinarimonas ramus]GGK31038.1 hypothetical protein GCM10011322_17030 [Salinarimonas ramus]
MIPADLSALVQTRGGGERGGGKAGGDAGGLGALFGKALDGLAGRKGIAGGEDGRRPSGDPTSGNAQDGASGDTGEGRLRSLLLGQTASLPIRPGALALQGQANPTGEGRVLAEGELDLEGEPADDTSAETQDASRDPASLLAALAGIGTKDARSAQGRVVRDTADVPRPAVPQAGPATGDADGAAADAADVPVSRARALFPERQDVFLATKAEPSVGMALKATVVSQATHLPPALGAANLAAVVDGATSLLGDGRTDGSGRATLAFSPDLATTGAHASLAARPVKVLTVQLQPISLGTVTIALRMTADGVAMEITAADSKAAAMLRADEKLIVDAVRRSGLAGEVVAIHTADAPRAAAQAQAGGDASGQTGNQANGHSNGQANGQAGGDGQARGEGGRQTGRDFTLERRSDDDAQSASHSRRGGDADGGVYL